MTSIPPTTRRDFLASAARSAAASATASLTSCMHPASLVAPTRPAPPGSPIDRATPDSLGTHAAAKNLLYGCALDMRALAAEPAYANLIRRQCRIVVAENAMKWAALRPSPTTFSFDQADALIAFAEASHIKVRGHNLLWYRDNPQWVEKISPETARTVLANHIETVVGRYAGRMHSWDVVNEAIETNDGRPDALRNSIWLRLIGEDYVEFAFRTARAADPQALLTYNDFGVEGEDARSEARRQAILLFLRRMVTRRIPIDAVGIQSHILAGIQPEYGNGLRTFIAAIRDLGLQVFITELDVNDNRLPTDPTTRDLGVAVAYKLYLDLVLADPAVRVVTTWGITDRYTWLNAVEARADGSQRCLPFDADLQPTAAFTAIRNAFDRRPPFAKL